MSDRGFNEIDVRAMMQDATEVLPAATKGRWRVKTVLNNRPWVIVVEPDFAMRLLVVITAYMLE